MSSKQSDQETDCYTSDSPSYLATGMFRRCSAELYRCAFKYAANCRTDLFESALTAPDGNCLTAPKGEGWPRTVDADWNKNAAIQTFASLGDDPFRGDRVL